MKTVFRKKGFTLIELMICVSIVAILVSIAVPMMKLQYEKSKIAEVTNAISAVSTSLYHYYEDVQVFPTINDGAAILTTLGVGVAYGMPDARIASIRILNGAIITTLANVSQATNGQQLFLTPSTTNSGAIIWSWSGSAGFPKTLIPAK